MEISKILKDFYESKPLYSPISLPRKMGVLTRFVLKEIQGDCPVCKVSKPFQVRGNWNCDINLNPEEIESDHRIRFECITCGIADISFWVKSKQVEDEVLQLTKIGQYPQKELPKSKALSKFFKQDKAEYNKAVVCLANGYGVAAFAYMRRIVENNIVGILDLIQDGVDSESPLAKSIAELKTTSPMSDRIRIANNVLPDYLKPDGFNPLGQIYGLLSDGVHSLSDEECLNKATDLQVCLEFLISELAAHKQNREDFKNRLTALRNK